MFSRDPLPDTSLNKARWRNDLCLKSRFESIFEKYSHDFTGIGDEVDVATGALVVNNGHLEAMEDEGDTGSSTTARRAQSEVAGNVNGGSLLRAMTVAPEDHGHSLEQVNDEEVIMSIEAMAENAVEHNYDEAPESPYSIAGMNRENESTDDELFQPLDKLDTRRSPADGVAMRGERLTIVDEASTSTDQHENPLFFGNDNVLDIMIKQEEDDGWQGRPPLFENHGSDRSSSPDSLFEAQQPLPDLQHPRQYGHESPSATGCPELGMNRRELSDDAILDKFGPSVGPQVLNVLQKRREMLDAHIEPAWRIPDIGVVFTPAKLNSPPDDLRLSAVPDHGKTESIWKEPTSVRPMTESGKNAKIRHVRESSEASNESNDPLQEGFQETREAKRTYQGYDEAGISLEDLQEGICPFCQKEFSVRASVYAHWDDLVRKSVRDGIHDMAYIRDQRSQARRRSRFPKVTVEDFRKIIKLHELEGMEWKEVQKQGNFGERPAASIHSIYYQYRTIAMTDEELASEGRSWTNDEDEKMLELYSQDPEITFQDLRKALTTRSQAEIGNRLASIWVQQHANEGLVSSNSSVNVRPISDIDGGRESKEYIGVEASQLQLDCSNPSNFRRSYSVDSEDSLFMAKNDRVFREYA